MGIGVGTLTLSANYQNYLCSFANVPDNNYKTNWLTLFIHILNTVSNTIFSMWIICYIKGRKRPNQQGMSKNERRLLQTTTLIWSRNVICCITLVIIQVWASLQDLNKYGLYMGVITMVFTSITNPFIVTFFNKQFIHSLVYVFSNQKK